MIEIILSNWWKVLLILAGCVLAFWGAITAVILFLSRARAEGVDEIEAGPVKVDFDKDK